MYGIEESEDLRRGTVGVVVSAQYEFRKTIASVRILFPEGSEILPGQQSRDAIHRIHGIRELIGGMERYALDRNLISADRTLEELRVIMMREHEHMVGGRSITWMKYLENHVPIGLICGVGHIDDVVHIAQQQKKSYQVLYQEQRGN